MVDILPAILATDESSFLHDLHAIGTVAPMIHIDICDGLFVPTKTWADPNILQTEIPVDCELHLMVKDPIAEATRWNNVAQVKRLLIHYESGDLEQFLASLESMGRDLGCVLNPETPTGVLEPYLDYLTTVMFMSVQPGKQGQPYIETTPQRIREFKRLHSDMRVAVDGGVSKQTLPELLSAGTDAVCIGSALFKNEQTPIEQYRAFEELTHHTRD